MIEVEEFFQSAHDDLIYELTVHGFVPAEQDAWTGSVRVQDTYWHLKIDFSSPYPAHPPRVFIEDDKPFSWHQNADGSLCLYSQSSPGAFPWFANGALLGRIRGWLERDVAGWVGDFPDLDLERYWESNPRFSLLVHDELPVSGTCWVRFGRLGPRTLVQSGFAWPPRNRPGSHTHLYGLLADIGEVATPPRSWGELAGLLKDPTEIEGAVRDRRADVVLLRYARDGHNGVLGLVPVPGGKREENLQFRSVSCASRSPQTLALRTGFQAPELSTKIVTIIGVGAVGSFIAESLFRSGVRRLLLVDGDLLRPGNVVRHAANFSFVGKPKAEAMALSLGDPVRGFASRMDSLASAMQYVEASDLVIDATANEVVTQILAEAGNRQEKSILSVYLANQGRSKVVEVLPSPVRERFIPRNMAPAGPDAIESGCGDPVSATPPFAVVEVAGMACRIATAILVGDTENAKSELRECP